jgi:hypothetical protein
MLHSHFRFGARASALLDTVLYTDKLNLIKLYENVRGRHNELSHARPK